METDAPETATTEPVTASPETTAEATTANTTPEAKPETTQEPAKAVVPEKYELALPKDSPLPAATLERTAAIARTLGLSQAGAQQMVDAVHAEAVEISKASTAAATKAQADHEAAWKPGEGAEWKRQQAEWKAEALKDTEIGGTPDKLQASQTKAAKVLAKFGTPGITEFLTSSGLGSHPDFVKMLARIGGVISEGSLALGTPTSDKPKSLAERMYPDGGTGPAKSAA